MGNNYDLRDAVSVFAEDLLASGYRR